MVRLLRRFVVKWQYEDIRLYLTLEQPGFVCVVGEKEKEKEKEKEAGY